MVSFQVEQGSGADIISCLKPMQHRVYVVSERLPKVLTQHRHEMEPCGTRSASEDLHPEGALTVFLTLIRADAVTNSPDALPVLLRIRPQ